MYLFKKKDSRDALFKCMNVKHAQTAVAKLEYVIGKLSIGDLAWFIFTRRVCTRIRANVSREVASSRKLSSFRLNYKERSACMPPKLK